MRDDLYEGGIDDKEYARLMSVVELANDEKYRDEVDDDYGFAVWSALDDIYTFSIHNFWKDIGGEIIDMEVDYDNDEKNQLLTVTTHDKIFRIKMDGVWWVGLIALHRYADDEDYIPGIIKKTIQLCNETKAEHPGEKVVGTYIFGRRAGTDIAYLEDKFKEMVARHYLDDYKVDLGPYLASKHGFQKDVKLYDKYWWKLDATINLERAFEQYYTMLLTSYKNKNYYIEPDAFTDIIMEQAYGETYLKDKEKAAQAAQTASQKLKS